MSFSGFDHECMATALRLARKGLYTTDPNPRVGCVIAGPNGVAGRGWHQRTGGPHAEIEALRDAAGPVRGMTAYVTLEPCGHQGRTPPCADALVEAGITRLVAAVGDPNPVSRGGFERLRSAGVKVETGLMADEAAELNCGFLKRVRTGFPWVRLKSAISLDGRTALANGESQWISSEASRADVQRWRGRSSALLTGIGTVLADDPSLEARLGGEVLQPLKVIADSRFRTPPGSRILACPERVLVAGCEGEPIARELRDSGAACLALPARGARIDLEALLRSLAQRGINEIQVEAGAALCGALLEARLVDELLIYQAPLLLGDGGPGPVALGPLESMNDRTHLSVLETSHLGSDLRIRLKPEIRR